MFTVAEELMVEVSSPVQEREYVVRCVMDDVCLPVGPAAQILPSHPAVVLLHEMPPPVTVQFDT